MASGSTISRSVRNARYRSHFKSRNGTEQALASSSKYGQAPSTARRRNGNGNGNKAIGEGDVPRPEPVQFKPRPTDFSIRSRSATYVPPDSTSMWQLPAPEASSQPTHTTQPSSPRLSTYPHGPSPLGSGPSSPFQSASDQLTPPNQMTAHLPDQPSSEPASMTRSLSYTPGQEDVLRTPHHSPEKGKGRENPVQSKPPPPYISANSDRAPQLAEQGHRATPPRSPGVKPSRKRMFTISNPDEIELQPFPIPRPFSLPPTISQAQPTSADASDNLRTPPLIPSPELYKPPQQTHERLAASFQLEQPSPSRRPLPPLPASAPGESTGPVSLIPTPVGGVSSRAETQNQLTQRRPDRSTQPSPALSKPRWSQEQYLKDFEAWEARRAEELDKKRQAAEALESEAEEDKAKAAEEAIAFATSRKLAEIHAIEAAEAERHAAEHLEEEQELRADRLASRAERVDERHHRELRETETFRGGKGRKCDQSRGKMEKRLSPNASFKVLEDAI
ncbi:uncharacterized protein I303_107266 [Kwoniella dejecticola CBS 10117]|uniref:Uncharacterized protein n=1 Tax=Kwoniella dejecticola CBS 10117 TaxID=1296121 RepID=A0A1A5ZZ71_9TREE|nr:uncharacterized protein I303_06668 [Kwoniella dejecticola CBS 10117]OBR83109.1 hypothetical protein I303_06668 [Kwoniella dejecticola CBS 10117]